MTPSAGPGRHFPYAYDRRLAPLWLPFRWPGEQGVTLTDDGRFVARYGPLRAEAPLSDVVDAHVTGPYRWWTACLLYTSPSPRDS